MKKFACLILLGMAACSQEGIQHDPQFTDWSYRTRDREHNRYDGYAEHHIREEQWQTDPYWTQGEGLERRKAARLTNSQYDKEAAQAPAQQKIDMPPERFVKGPKKTQ